MWMTTAPLTAAGSSCIYCSEAFMYSELVALLTLLYREAVDRFRTQQRIYEPLRFIREDPDSMTARTNTFGKMLFEAVWWQKRLVVKTKRKKNSKLLGTQQS